ncbi:MAG TPA: hypothetical protein VGE83_07210 [Terracidiphilus sp.]|jgi:hypothetical protein
MLKNFLQVVIVALMADPLPDYDPLPTEIEQVVDEARRDSGKGPAPRTPEEGIRDMQARIAYHTTLIGKLHTQLKNAKPNRIANLKRLIADSEHQLTEARQRLTEYQTQLDGQN